MGRYITTQSNFKPFSYAELVTPLKELQAEHNLVEEQLAALKTNAALQANKLNPDTDGDIYQQYLDFTNSLDSYADQLSNRGLSSMSRRGLYDMSSRYNLEIAPIEEWYKQRQQDIDTYRKAKLNNDDLLLDRDPSQISLSEYKKGPVQIKQIDLKNLSAKASALYGTLQNNLRAYNNKQPVDKYTDAFLKEYGLDWTDVAKFMKDPNSPEGNSLMKAIYDNLYNSSGVASWNNPYAEQKVRNAILMAAPSAIGKEDVTYMDNKANLKALDYYYQTKLKEQENSDQEEDIKKYGYISRTDKILTTKEKTELQEEIDWAIKSGYLAKDKNGNITGYTKSGLDAYRTSNAIAANPKELNYIHHLNDVKKNPFAVPSVKEMSTQAIRDAKSGGFSSMVNNEIDRTTKAKNKANEIGRKKYGDSFNVDKANARFYNLMNTLQSLKTEGKNNKAWFGKDPYKVGGYSINALNKNVTDIFKDSGINPNVQLIGHAAIQTAIDPDSADTIRSNISLSTGGDDIETYTMSSKGWTKDSYISKEKLGQYQPVDLVTLKDGTTMIRMEKLNTSTSKTSVKYGEEIYIPAPKEGHYYNYNQQIQTYFNSMNIIDQFQEEMRRKGITRIHPSEIPPIVTQALENVNLQNANNVLFRGEADIIKALSSLSETKVNNSNQAKQ